MSKVKFVQTACVTMRLGDIIRLITYGVSSKGDIWVNNVSGKSEWQKMESPNEE